MDGIRSDVEALADMFYKIPRVYRKILVKDLRRYKEGIPDNVIYQPLTWCGKPYIILLEGERGLYGYLEHVTEERLSALLQLTVKALEVATVPFVVALLSNRQTVTQHLGEMAATTTSAIDTNPLNSEVDDAIPLLIEAIGSYLSDDLMKSDYGYVETFRRLSDISKGKI